MKLEQAFNAEKSPEKILSKVLKLHDTKNTHELWLFIDLEWMDAPPALKGGFKQDELVWQQRESLSLSLSGKNGNNFVSWSPP